MSNIVTNFELLQYLPASTQNEINRVLAIPTGNRSAKEAAEITARTPYLTNQLLVIDQVNNLILEAAGNTLPTGYTGFQRGAKFINLSTGASYFNTGDKTSAAWAYVVPTVNQATIILSAAQIIAMFTTPVQLIAGVTNKTIVVTDISVKCLRGTVAFTGGDNVEFRYTDASGQQVVQTLAVSFVTGAQGTDLVFLSPAPLTSPNAIVGVVGARIVITNPTQAFAAGNGTFEVSIGYRLV